LTAHAFASVNRPKGVITPDLTTNSPKVKFGEPGILAGKYLYFGDTNSSGITWSGYVLTPANGAGKIAYTQIVKANRWHVGEASGAIKEWFSSHGTNVIDSNKGGVDYKGIVIDVNNSRGTEIATDDNPAVYATGDSDYPSFKAVGVDESFSTYLSYRPTGAEDDTIWVTLSKLTWEWHGSAAKSTNDLWQVDPASDASVSGLGEDISELPTWTGTVEHITWQPE
jgi:hypothetical protein